MKQLYANSFDFEELRFLNFLAPYFDTRSLFAL